MAVAWAGCRTSPCSELEHRDREGGREGGGVTKVATYNQIASEMSQDQSCFRHHQRVFPLEFPFITTFSWCSVKRNPSLYPSVS